MEKFSEMKKWQLLELDENGNVDFDIIREFQWHNPIKRIKAICPYLTKNGYIFRVWNIFPYGENYFSGNWYKYQNGKITQIVVEKERVVKW